MLHTHGRVGGTTISTISCVNSVICTATFMIRLYVWPTTVSPSMKFKTNSMYRMC
ncbi:Uncharacterised protein [Vibrio cholerae]|nr:Uncharacterised protein [Vibrio cholerae]